MGIRIPRKHSKELHTALHRTSGTDKDHTLGYRDYVYGYFSDKVNKLLKEMKEVSKQQKYLWQTLEDLYNLKKEE